MRTANTLFAIFRCDSPAVYFGRASSIIFTALFLSTMGCQSNPAPATSAIVSGQTVEDRISALSTQAMEEYKNGNFDQCQTTLQAALRLAPENVHLLILSAKLNIERGQLAAAQSQLIQAGTIAPNNGEIEYLSGVVLQRQQQPQKALQEYELAVKNNPAELSYVMAESEVLIALDRSDDALKLLKDKIVYFEQSATIRDALGQLLMEQNRYSDAAEILRQASLLADNDQTLREHLAFALYYSKQYSAACQAFTRLLKDEAFTSRADIYAALGECQSRCDRLREARQNLQNAVQLDANSIEYWLALGRVTTQLGDLPRAELAIRKAMSIQPRSADAQCLLGYLQVRENRWSDALAAFRAANQIDPSDTVSLCMQGYVLEKLGKSDEAVLLFARALKLNPSDELASRLMASADLRDGN